MTSFMLETKAYWEPHAYWVLVREPERNRPQGRPRSRSKHTVKIDVREEGQGGMGFINMTEDGEHDDEPLGVYKMFGNY